MRLIDADALIERLQEYADNDWNKSLGGIFIDCIDTCIDYVENAPTAYDTDKVVAELEEGGQKMSEAKGNPWDSSDHKYYKAISVKKATAIVKAGGAE